MADIFRSRESMAQDAEMNAYAASLAKIAQEQREKAEKVNDFNERLGSIVDPIGGAILTKPIEGVVKAGARKALGYGAKAVEKKITQKLSDLVNGDSEYMTKLPSNVQRGLKAVLQDNPETNIRSGFNQLSQKAQDTINQARQRLGKSKINGNPEQDTPRSDPQSSTGESRGDAPTNEGDPDVDQPNLDDVRQGMQDVRARFRQLPEESQNTLDQQFRDNPLRVDNPSTAEDYSTNLNLRAQAVQQEEERLGQGQQPAPSTENSNPVGEGSNDDAGGDASPQSLQEPRTINQESQASSSGNNPDPDNSGQGNLENTDTSVGDVNAAESGATDGADAVSGLSDAAEALDAISAAQGGADIFTDILAGIVGLATVIGGSAGKKSVSKPDSDPISSGIQFGI